MRLAYVVVSATNEEQQDFGSRLTPFNTTNSQGNSLTRVNTGDMSSVSLLYVQNYAVLMVNVILPIPWVFSSLNTSVGMNYIKLCMEITELCDSGSCWGTATK